MGSCRRPRLNGGVGGRRRRTKTKMMLVFATTLMLLLALFIPVEARKGGRMSRTPQRGYSFGEYDGSAQVPHNIFEKGKGEKGKAGMKRSKKSNKHGKGKNPGSGKGGGLAFAGLQFRPRFFPVGSVAEIDATVRATSASSVDFFNLYLIDADTGQATVPVTMLFPSPTFPNVFEGSFFVESNTPGETFSFISIPVIAGVEDPSSPLVVVQLRGIRSTPGTPGGNTPSPTPDMQVPTPPLGTAAPTEPTSLAPTMAPVTAAPTEPKTSMPTRAPVAPVTSTPTVQTTDAPTLVGETAMPVAQTTTVPTMVPAATTAAPTISEPVTTGAPVGTGDPGFNELLSIQGRAGAEFGFAVALNNDGSLLAIAAPADDENAFDGGKVSLYSLDGNTEDLLFEFSGAQTGLQVGLALSISTMSTPDGPRLAIGGSNFVDVYGLNQFIGGNPPVNPAFDRFQADFVNEGFGSAVSVSGSGRNLAVGSPTGSFGEGMAQVYIIDTMQLIGMDVSGDEEDDQFGRDVALSGDGDILAVGAPGLGGAAGYARIFRLSGDMSTWDVIGQTILGGQAGDNFGRSISISGDGLTVAIGAVQPQGTGFVQVYRLVGETWTQLGQDLVGQTSGDMFGVSVALTPDGSFVAVGANANDGAFTNAGFVRVYENQGGTWVAIGQDLTGSVEGRSLGTGVAISADGGTLAAGGPRSTASVATDVGEVVVYDI